MTASLYPGFWRNPYHVLALGFGAGFVPHMPGTAGTLLGIPIYWLLADLSLPWYAVAVLVLFLVGVRACGITAQDLSREDPPEIVWDEVVGLLVTLSVAGMDVLWVAIGFVAFRFFDIVKPWPIKWVERRYAGGLGIMLDDVVAGALAGFVVWLLKKADIFDFFLN